MSVAMQSRAVPSIDYPWSAVLLLVLLAAEALMIAAQTQALHPPHASSLPPEPKPNPPQAMITLLRVAIRVSRGGTTLATPMLGIVVALYASIQSVKSSG
jgi:hypothetical protein